MTRKVAETTTATETEPRTLDPHGLLQNGEAIGTPGEIARMVPCSANVLRELLRGPLAGHVRSVEHHNPGRWRYAVADVLEAIKPHLAWIEERRQRAAEREAAERAAGAAKRHAARAPKPASAPKGKGSKPATSLPSTRAGGPEIIVRRARA